MSSGRTKPSLMHCEDEDGNQEEAVVKLRAGFERKETGAVCELVASLLAKDLDLPVAEPLIVSIEKGFDRAVPDAEVAPLMKGSVGMNFATKKLPSGLNTWLPHKSIPMLLRPLATEILAFDALIQNPDRHKDNANVLWRGDELYIFDHELAFSFVGGMVVG